MKVFEEEVEYRYPDTNDKLCGKCFHFKAFKEFSWSTTRVLADGRTVRYLDSYCKKCRNTMNHNRIQKMKENDIVKLRKMGAGYRRSYRRKLKDEAYKPINNHKDVIDVKILIDYLKHEDIDLGTLSESMGVDRSRFRKIMKEEYDTVTIDFVERVMIAQGKTLHDLDAYYNYELPL